MNAKSDFVCVRGSRSGQARSGLDHHTSSATHLPLSLPVLNVVASTDEAIQVDVLCLSDIHLLGGCDVAHGDLTRVCLWDPYFDWDVIGVALELNGYGPS